MIYAHGRRAADAQRADLARPSAPPSCSRTTEILALAAGPSPSRRTTAARWTWSGPRTARPASCSSCRRGRRPCSRAATPARCGPTRSRRRAGSLSTGLAHRRRGRRRARLPDRERRAISTASSTARSWSPTTTDPDWVPIMKRAAAIVTDHGGRTSHAAIVSRELGVPAIVGTGNATHVLHDGQDVTVSCAEGERGLRLRGHRRVRGREARLSRTCPRPRRR